LLLSRGYRPTTAEEAVLGRERLLHVTFDDGYRSVLTAIPVLERLGLPGTVFVCTTHVDDGRPPSLARAASGRIDGDAAMLSWNALRDLAERGVEVGSHSATHPHLTRISDAELEYELRKSRGRIEDELGRPCRYLAYPYGDHDERVRDAVRNAGYAAAFALPGRLRPYDAFAVPRVSVLREDGRLRFTLKTSPARRIIGQVLRWR
jgi:peptidoglycan/xylan/chitin deacetylase (PgdA/CDA1 family)